ncbi:MAG: aspartyl protease family protein [Candidatus Aegiribacteria sp.]|nr:aspartyl protease family protein [Candidatus Aegiribacteria sp.]
MKHIFLFALIALLVPFLTGCGQDEGSPTDSSGDTAAESVILQNCVEALGGEEAVRNIRVIHTIDSLSMAGMTGMTESWWVREPFMGFSVTEIGPIVQQVLMTGDSVWTVDRNGHLSPGGMEQKDQMMLSRVTVFYDYLFDASMISLGADTLIDSVAAVPLYLEDQPNVVFYYSKETWLPLLMTAVTMGIEVRSYPDDYENIEGIVSATSSISTIPAMGQEIENWNILTEYNVTVPESIFVLTSAGGDWELENPGAPTAFSLKGEHIYLDGEVNGNPVTILLDSGAGATVLDSTLAAELGLEGTGSLPARGIGGTREFSFAKVPTYYAAGALVSDQTLAVMPLSEEFYPSTGEMIDLIIGYDFLSRFVTRIDYGSETITLFDPDSFSIDSDDISILPAERSMSLLSIEAVLEDSVPVTLLLDTGAGGSIHLTPSFFESHPQFLGDRPTFETVIQGVGGEETISGFRVSDITLGDYTVPGGLCSSFDGGDMFSQYDGILGNAVLCRFILYLDYSSGQIILEPSSLFEEGLSESLTGMGLEIENNSLLVSKVIQGSPAEEAGILEGDILLEVDGIPVNADQLNDLSDLLPDTAGAAVSLKFMRDDNEIDLELITDYIVPM